MSRRLLIAAVLLLILASCRWVEAGVARATATFEPHAVDPRIRVAPGAEPLAERAASALPEAITMVETAQGAPFARPPIIYVFATAHDFAAYSGCSEGPSAAAFGDEVYLSGKLSRAEERVPRLLAHELSHVHLTQRVGLLAFRCDLPPWFKEGLATLVSGGGGAETVDEATARQAVADGRHILPEACGSLWSEEMLTSEPLGAHLRYRQAALVVAHLSRDREAFSDLLADLEHDVSLAAALRRRYRLEVAQLWERVLAVPNAGSSRDP